MGRSPRMQYHASSLARMEGVDAITMIGYEGENINNDIKSNSKVKEKRLKPVNIDYLRKYSSLGHALIKGLMLFINLIRALSEASPYDILLIQNPPCLPVLLAAAFLNTILLTKPHNKIILDWHNLGYSMFTSYKPSPCNTADETVNDLPVEPARQSLLVHIARLAEIFLTRSLIHHHICVSKAMKKYLELKCHAKDVIVLYDRPMRRQPVHHKQLQQQHELFIKYGLTDKEFNYPAYEVSPQVHPHKSNQSTMQSTSIHTKCISVNSNDDNEVLTYELREDKPFTIITATSWTPDEDFDMLLSAVVDIEQHLATYNLSMTNTRHYHKLTIIITGKGPLRTDFEQKIQAMEVSFQLIYVKVRCLWLSSEDYFQLLSYADIGLCLHTSTCGLDLPMKVLDMLGAGLVVLASRYYAISEIIRHEENGLLFHGSKDLVENILRLMMNSNNNKLVKLQHKLQQQQVLLTWHENWDEVMKPLMQELIAKPGIQGVGYYYLYLISMISILVLLMAYLSYHIAHAKASLS